MGKKDYTDPTLGVDHLPQPYRFINKLLSNILTLVEEQAEQRAIERLNSKTFNPPALTNSQARKTRSCVDATCCKLKDRWLYVGTADGTLQVTEPRSREQKDKVILGATQALPSAIKFLDVVIRTSDSLPLIACAGVNPLAGITVLGLHTPDPAGDDCESLSSADLGSKSSKDKGPTLERLLHIPATETLPLHLLSELHLAPEGKFVSAVLGNAGKVIVWETKLEAGTVEVKKEATPALALTPKGGKKQKPQRRGSRSSGGSVLQPGNDNVQERKEIRVISGPFLVAAAPEHLTGPILTEPKPRSEDDGPSKPQDAYVPYPVVHFISNEAAEGSISGAPGGSLGYRGRRPREVHSLVVGWVGLNVFSTYSLSTYNPYLSNNLAFPRFPASQDSNGKVPEPPSSSKGKAKDAKPPKTPSGSSETVSGTEETNPKTSAPSPCLHHILPTLFNTMAISPSNELLGLGCSDGIVIVWSTILGVPKYILNKAPTRTMNKVKDALVCQHVAIHQKSYLVACHGVPNKSHSSNISVYDLGTGLLLHTLKYLDQVQVMTCLNKIPFAVFCCNPERVMLAMDIPSGQVIAQLPLAPEDQVLLGSKGKDDETDTETMSEAPTRTMSRAKSMASMRSAGPGTDTMSPTPGLRTPMPPQEEQIETPVDCMRPFMELSGALQCEDDVILVKSTVSHDCIHEAIVEVSLEGKVPSPPSADEGTEPSSKARRGDDSSVDPKNIHSLSKVGIPCRLERVALSEFYVPELVKTAYKLMGDVVASRDADAVYKVVNGTKHQDRLDNKQLMQQIVIPTVLSSTLVTGIQKKNTSTLGRSITSKKGKDNLGSSQKPDAVTFSPRGDTVYAPAISAPKEKSKEGDWNPTTRTKSILNDREEARYDREGRLSQRWQEMLASH